MGALEPNFSLQPPPAAKARALPHDVLTWDAAAPAPFESAFSIFAKLMHVNCASWRELFTLLTTQAPHAPCRTALIALHSSGFWNLARICAMTGMQERQLRRAFVYDLVGACGMGNNFDVRGCLKCMKLRYLCALHELAIVSHCPWHGCELVRLCTPNVLSNPAARARLPSRTFHVAELDPWLGAYRGERLSYVDEALAERIEQSCLTFMGWWMHVNEQAEIHRLRIDALHHKGCLPAAYGESARQWRPLLEQAIEFAQQAAGRCPWPLGIRFR